MIKVSIAMIVLALWGGPAFGEPAKPGFASVDMNRDGTVSLAEFATLFRTESVKGFEELDRDGDGRLTAEEYAQMSPRLMVAHR